MINDTAPGGERVADVAVVEAEREPLGIGAIARRAMSICSSWTRAYSSALASPGT
jgi:hypothetical protein